MGKKGPLWWRESDWLLRGSSAANQILLRHSGPILSNNGGNIQLQIAEKLNVFKHGLSMMKSFKLEVERISVHTLIPCTVNATVIAYDHIYIPRFVKKNYFCACHLKHHDTSS